MICWLLYLYNQATRPLTFMQFGVILGGATLGIFHNLFFHPVVWGAWALALAAAGDITTNYLEDPEFPDSTEIDSPRI